MCGYRFQGQVVPHLDVETGAELAVLRGHTDKVNAVAVMPGGTRIVTGSDDGTARVWDAATGKELHVLRGHQKEVIAVAVTLDGSRILTAGGLSDNTVSIWNATTGEAQA